MGRFTIRNLDPELERRIRERAGQSGKSISRTLKELLGEALDKPQSRQVEVAERHRRLDQFCGIWTDEDLREFNKAVPVCKRVNPQDWQRKSHPIDTATLERLCGAMSEEDWREADEVLKDFERIDPQDWE